MGAAERPAIAVRGRRLRSRRTGPPARRAAAGGRPHARRRPHRLRLPEGGRAQIEAAVAAGAGTVDAIGAATGAGTNCGSCRPEITRLIAANFKERAKDAA